MLSFDEYEKVVLEKEQNGEERLVVEIEDMKRLIAVARHLQELLPYLDGQIMSGKARKLLQRLDEGE